MYGGERVGLFVEMNGCVGAWGVYALSIWSSLKNIRKSRVGGGSCMYIHDTYLELGIRNRYFRSGKGSKVDFGGK